MPDRAAVGVGGGRRRRGEAVVVVVALGGEEPVAAERAGGARADEPGVDAGAVEDVAAPQLAHLLAVADRGEAEGAVRVRVLRLLLLPLPLPAAAVHGDGEAVAGLGRQQQRRVVVVGEHGRAADAGARDAVAQHRGARGPPGLHLAAERQRRHAEARLADHQHEERARQGHGRVQHGR